MAKILHMVKGGGILLKKRYIDKFRKTVIYAAVFTVLTGSMFEGVPAFALGGFNLKSEAVTDLINEYSLDIAPGVAEKHYSFEDKEGKMTEVFVTEVDVKNPAVSIEAATPNDGDSYGRQTVREQAGLVSADSHRVVAAVNGDYFNMSTGEPFGVVYKDGRAVKPGQFSTWKFFAVTKDGKPVIGDAAYFEQIKGSIKEALGGQAILVKDGKAFETPEFNPERNPRTAVCIRSDGSVFFAAVDGRQEPYSSGISAGDFAELLIDLGAEHALDLDGGGSTTYVSTNPGEDGLKLKNRPSDGIERSVANSWIVVSTAKSDGKFNSAFIEPFDKSYTPGTAVVFSGKGMDKSMAPAPMPSSGLSWQLSNKKFGSMNKSGKFISNGKTGEFQALLKKSNKTVGSAWIEVRHPDEMYFASPEITVSGDSEKILDLIMKYEKRTLEWKPEDIEWKVPKFLGKIDKEGVLHTSKDPLPGKIIAKYKKKNLSAELYVNIARSPETIFGFEDGTLSWTSSTAGRGETGSVELSSDKGGQVRFGDKALKINFDFTVGQKNATLGVYAGPGNKALIPGNPTSIGMWVYATPEAKGYWLRMAVIDGKGTVQNINLTSGNPGIDWTGWKYVEASLPSQLTGPFYIHPLQAIRMMSTNSGTTGPMTKGSIYVDDIMAVYGE